MNIIMRWLLLFLCMFCWPNDTMLSQTVPDWSRSGGDQMDGAEQSASAWYGSETAVENADRVVLYQRDAGGWKKSIDYNQPLTPDAAAKVIAQKSRTDCTIDNGATYTQIRYLAQVYHATGIARFRSPLIKGIQWLLDAQYPNGGWPQYYPNTTDYNPSNSSHNTRNISGFITYNDNAMLGAMGVLNDVAQQVSGFAFVGKALREEAAGAVKRGIECILKTQLKENGVLTGWCAQYDERTLKPLWGRTFEPVSLSGSESVGLVLFLMDIDQPSDAIIAAVQGAVAWFDEVKITRHNLEKIPDESAPRGWDRRLISDVGAPALWARFYELGTNRPIFAGRGDNADVVLYRMDKLSKERRTGYSYYGTWPAKVLQAYPAWQQRWAPNDNVLAQ
jgi:PelA/Pel-15E family pectate lyase